MLLRKAFWLALLTALVFAVPLWAQGPAEAPPGDAEAPAATDRSAAEDAADGADADAAGDEAPADTTDAGPSAGGSADGADYLVRMRDLEHRVDRLKEQIRRSHTRLSLLSETVLASGVGGARAEIRFTNDMSSAFRMERLLVVLDGAVQFNKQATSGRLTEQDEVPIFSGFIPPGDHTLQVLVRLRGHGYGVFSYLRGYQFELKSAHSFTVTEGKIIELNIIAWEKGNVTVPLEQRPSVRYVEKLKVGGAFGARRAKQRQPAVRGSGRTSVGAGTR